MNEDSSISLNETFEELGSFQDSPSHASVHPLFQERIRIGRGEFLIKSASDALTEFEYECPDWAYEGGPQCEGICVWVPQSDQPSGWRLCCFGCEGTHTCLTPVRPFSFYRILKELTGFQFAITQCVDEYEAAADSFDASFLPGNAALLGSLQKVFDQPVEFGILKLPSIYNPSQHLTVRLALGAEPLYLSFPNFGWRATILPNQLPPSEEEFPGTPVVAQLPSVSPVASIDPAGVALAASVILPEYNGAQQFWLTVPESSRHPQSPLRYASLVTQRWTVMLYRQPVPARVRQDGSDCGCH